MGDADVLIRVIIPLSPPLKKVEFEKVPFKKGGI